VQIGKIPVFILCGGLGTRLKEMTEFRPKPMIPIGPDPILIHIMKHCKDIARAFIAFFEAPRAVIHNQSVNIGADAENYQVRDIADIVQRLVSGARIVYTGEVGKDPRDYRVDFGKLSRHCQVLSSNTRWRRACRNCSQNIENTVSRQPISTASSSSGCVHCAIVSTG
jgi:hypothetical protein